MGSSCSADREDGGCRPRASSRKRKERKRQMMDALAAEAKTSELLSRIPGRMCTNGASSTASLFTQQGRKGTNQDAMVVWENYASRKDTIFCGVFDGHGPYGHLVARRVRDTLPSKLMSIWKARMRGEDDAGSGYEESDWLEATSEVTVDSPSKLEPEMYARWRDSILKGFNLMDRDLRTHPTIDCFCSGSTAVTVLKQGDDLVIGNVGDSRAVLATRTEDDKLEAIQLTVDLKPNLPNEAERIRRCKGRVFALEDEPEVARVWLPYDDAPGLAMARAMGDFCLKDFGLISVPEITYRRVTESDQFVILATDGVWDVLSNKEVVDVVSCAPTRATAARALVETAMRAWRLKYPTSKMDDCAAVCLFLNQFRTSSSAAAAGNKVEGLDQLRADDPQHYTNGITSQPGFAAPTTAEGEEEEEEEEELDHSSVEWSGGPALDAAVMTFSHRTAAAEEISWGRSNTVGTPTHFPGYSSSNDCITEVVEDDDAPSSSTAEIARQQQQQGGVERSQSRRSLADCLSAADDDNEWSALEGVVRVNSLLNLPRFKFGDKRGAGTGPKRRH